MRPNYDTLYDKDYYARYTEQGYDGLIIRYTLHTLIENIISICHPDAILDVGCAFNYITQYAIEHHGLNDSLGIDISRYAYEHSYAPQNHLVLDVSKPFIIERQFDLVTCIEVAEHLIEEDVQVLLDNLVLHARKYIYFSSTPDDITEPTHFFVKPTQYWIDEFAKRGFVHYPYFTDLNNIEWGMLFLDKDLIE